MFLKFIEKLKNKSFRRKIQNYLKFLCFIMANSRICPEGAGELVLILHFSFFSAFLLISHKKSLKIYF